MDLLRDGNKFSSECEGPPGEMAQQLSQIELFTERQVVSPYSTNLAVSPSLNLDDTAKFGDLINGQMHAHRTCIV